MAEEIVVTATTWTRDSHALFDYESSNVETVNFNVAGPVVTCSRIRNGTHVFAREEVPATGERLDILCRLERDAAGIYTVKALGSEVTRLPWLVVRDLPQRRHKLVEGDIIRMGRFKFCVRQLVTESVADETLAVPSHFGTRTAVCVPSEQAPSKTCRICLEEGENDADADPLIAPCACKGTIEYVHFGCLKRWIGTKYAGSGRGQACKIVQPVCDICRTSLPSQVSDPSGEKPLVEVPPMQPPYIVLECRSRQNGQLPLHIASLANGAEMRVGRSKNCEVRIDDVSLSRTHATIVFDDGFMLQDNDSKFGTLVSMRQEQQILPGSTLSLQCGRTCLALASPN